MIRHLICRMQICATLFPGLDYRLKLREAPTFFIFLRISALKAVSSRSTNLAEPRTGKSSLQIRGVSMSSAAVVPSIGGVGVQ